MQETSNKVDNEELEYDMEALYAKAGMFGIKYNANIGGKKLKEKIDLHLQDLAEAETEVEESKTGTTSVGPNRTIRDIEKKARKTRTVIITDNNPLDVDNPTIVHGVQNAYFKIGPVIIKKETEQNVPQAIIDALKVKTMVKWVPSINHLTKRPTGNKIAETRKRYNIQFV